jgi:hypothetical protein
MTPRNSARRELGFAPSAFASLAWLIGPRAWADALHTISDPAPDDLSDAMEAMKGGDRLARAGQTQADGGLAGELSGAGWRGRNW